MKNLIRRTAACCLAAWLLVMPVFSASLPLADSLMMSDSYQEDVREEVLVYRPGGDVRPVMVYGDTLYGRSTMAYIEEYLSDRGYTAAAAITAAFFDMNNGIPYGMVVTEGILRTGGNVMTVGLYENGSIQIGMPDLEITMDHEAGTTMVTGYDYTPIYILAEDECDGDRRVIRIDNAINAYEGNYVDKVTKACYDSMKNALERIAARVAGK